MYECRAAMMLLCMQKVCDSEKDTSLFGHAPGFL